jgi:hypothetical protein
MRWTSKRKEAIVVAIKKGLIETAEAQRQYGLSDEELAAWMRDYTANGRPGLRVTKLQHYQRGPPRQRTQKNGRGGVWPRSSERDIETSTVAVAVAWNEVDEDGEVGAD